MVMGRDYIRAQTLEKLKTLKKSTIRRLKYINAEIKKKGSETQD